MPEIMSPEAGTFCWFEVATRDLLAAKKYYGELFGWSFEDVQLGELPYAMARLHGKHVGGITMLSTEARRLNVPPHILSYVAVENAEEVAVKVAGLGGKQLTPVTDGKWGRMALVQDPAGGFLSLWQRKLSMGPWLFAEQGAYCWNELLTTDAAKAQHFYEALFGWTSSTMPYGDGDTYTIFRKGETQVGGMAPMPQELKKPSSWHAYLHVPDVDQTLVRATRMGGKVLLPAMDVETVGRMAMLQDGEGVMFSVLQPELPG